MRASTFASKITVDKNTHWISRRVSIFPLNYHSTFLSVVEWDECLLAVCRAVQPGGCGVPGVAAVSRCRRVRAQPHPRLRLRGRGDEPRHRGPGGHGQGVAAGQGRGQRPAQTPLRLRVRDGGGSQEAPSLISLSPRYCAILHYMHAELLWIIFYADINCRWST